MVESWIDLEKRITSKSPKDLRADLLIDIRFILENYSTPRIYYERTNSMANKINDKFATIVSRKIAKAQYESMIRFIKGTRGYED